MSTVSSTVHDLPTPSGVLRTHVVAPTNRAAPGPVLLAWSDIFQQTPSHRRMIERLASYGFTVVSPELYGRLEPPGTILDFEKDRDRALQDAERMELAWLDEDQRTVLDFAAHLPGGTHLAAIGWCFGGHLAFRAALDPRIKATVCCYATGLHNDTLGAAHGTATTLARASELKGRLLMIWGAQDPHIPAEGRQLIDRQLQAQGLTPEVRVYQGAHAFMRDEGPRWNPEQTDQAVATAVAFLRRPGPA